MVLEAASDIVAQDGVAALSTRQIAKQIGYTVGTLYNVFENLDDIVLHVNDQTLAQLESRFEHVLTNQHTVYALGEQYIHFCGQFFSVWDALFSRHVPAEKPIWYQERLDRIFVIIEQIILPEVDHNKLYAQKATRVLWASPTWHLYIMYSPRR